MMKQRLLKTIALGLMAMVGMNAWAGDFIDDATTIKVAGNDASATTGDKKTLTFTPTGTEIKIDFTFSDKTVTLGQIFGVVEYSGAGSNTDMSRFRYLTLNNGSADTELEEGTKASSLSFTVNGNTVRICPFLQNDVSNAAKVMKTYYMTNVDKSSLTIKSAGMYVGGTSGTEMTLNRVGIYTLGEILELYPSLKSNNFQINEAYRLLNDASALGINNSKTNNGTDNGLIETKNAAITTLAGCKLWLKAIDFAKIPDNYRYFWFRFLQPSDEASREDLFADMNENATLMLSFGTGSNPHILPYLPTMHKKLIDFDRNMYNYTFVDGIAPSSSEKVDVKGSQTTSYATYSRNLKAGYNSCIMPFKKFANVSDVPEGISFYKVDSYNGGTITFNKIENPTADNAFTNGSDNWTPIIIKAETAGVYTFVGRDGQNTASGYKSKKVGNSGDDPNAIYWVGSFVNEAPMASGNAYYDYTACYGISTDGSEIKKMKSNTKTTYYRAFIADNRPASAPALSLGFTDGNGTTDIKRIEDVDGMDVISDGAIYNLQGVRMNADNLPRGIYVRNGKKFVVK